MFHNGSVNYCNQCDCFIVLRSEQISSIRIHFISLTTCSFFPMFFCEKKFKNKIGKFKITCSNTCYNFSAGNAPGDVGDALK